MHAPRNFAGIVISLILCAGSAHAQSISTVEAYNSSLIMNGISWKEGSVVYYPSFYTGFAPRIEDANRIHVRVARGNQVRLTATLDEMAILTYPYSLKKRLEVMTSMINSKTIVPVQHRLVDSFRSVIESDNYKLLSSIERFEKGQMSREAFYEQSLQSLKALNPGRIFDLRFNLRTKALQWRERDLLTLADRSQKSGASNVNAIKNFLVKSNKEAIVATNNLLFGRVNATFLNDQQLTKLAELVSLTLNNQSQDDAFVEKTVAFFKDVTAGRYDFQVVVGGQARPALLCTSVNQCDLSYTEFTGIYPNGSVRTSVTDRDGNSIPMIRENGVTKFVGRSYGDVDHIRTEPFYGFIPKMDYTNAGNGLHNPAVRTYLQSSLYKNLYGVLGIPKQDSTLWIVSRGEVSHGCTRLAAGHILEVREIFPSNPEEMMNVRYTGNLSADYDLYDIDGSGQEKVMGVDYLIAYAIVSDTGAGYREGNGLIAESFKKDPFYAYLYGKNQYQIANGQYVFQNPYVSYFTGKPTDERAIAFSIKKQGDYALYEQAYEKDKLQFYDIPRLGIGSLSGDSNDRTSESHQLVRLFGRITGCGPFIKEFKKCHEAAFETEMTSVLARVH